MRLHGNPVPEWHKEATKLIKVLIVEDSPVVRGFLVYLLGSDPHIRVVGTAKPNMDGLEATRRIMETDPTPS